MKQPLINGKTWMGLNPRKLTLDTFKSEDRVDHFWNDHQPYLSWIFDRQHQLKQKGCWTPALEEAFTTLLLDQETLFEQMSNQQRQYEEIPNHSGWEGLPELWGLGLSEQEQALASWEQEGHAIITTYQRWHALLNTLFTQVLSIFARQVTAKP